MNPYIASRHWADFITIMDYVLLPFFLMVVYAIAYRFRNKHYPHRHPWRKYFIPAFTAKLAGGIFIGLIYQYYYRGGDTSAFFYHAKVINQSFGDSIITWFKLIFHTAHYQDPEVYQYINQMRWYRDPSSYTVSAITAVINLLTFNTYLPSTVIFAALSFTGYWALFRTFAVQYPRLTSSIAVAFLFIPSTIIWGSGIFKDTICMTALGWMTHYTFKMLIQKRIALKPILVILICSYFLAMIKVYILLVFLPSLFVWVFNTYSHKIKKGPVRALAVVVSIALVGGGFFYFSSSFSQQLGAYSLDNLAETSTQTREYILWVSQENDGSGYDLGPIEPTLAGMLSKFPQAVNVTLFRPYLWEAKKPIVFLNALEALLCLFFTIKVIVNVGLRGMWKCILTNPNVQFFLLFTLVFAFAVGISSYNFGTLSRYRIPCLPFYAASLLVMYYSKVNERKPFFTLKLKDSIKSPPRRTQYA